MCLFTQSQNWIRDAVVAVAETQLAEEIERGSNVLRSEHGHGAVELGCRIRLPSAQGFSARTSDKPLCS